MLLRNGTPWHIAWGENRPGEPGMLDEEIRLALYIAMGELEGGTYDWDEGGWQRRDGT